MPSLIDLRRRIRAVKSTQQITKAMKMIAASRLKRAQDRVVSARPFAQRMLKVLNGLVSRVDQEAHPLLRIPRSDVDDPLAENALIDQRRKPHRLRYRRTLEQLEDRGARDCNNPARRQGTDRMVHRIQDEDVRVGKISRNKVCDNLPCAGRRVLVPTGKALDDQVDIRRRVALADDV